MFLTNHTLTGVVLSRVIDDPILLAPAALASHLAVDAIPHFGNKNWKFGSKPWIRMAVVDNLIALSIFVSAMILMPERRLQVVVGVFFATLPDLLFIIELLRGKSFETFWRRFHSWVQNESLAGGVSEIIWASAMIFLLVGVLH